MKKHFGNFSACTDIALQVRLVHAGHSAMAEMYIVVLLFLTCFCVCMQNSAEDCLHPQCRMSLDVTCGC